MARIKYYYDTETCKYERVKTRKTDIILNLMGILALTAVMAGGLIILYYNFFDSPKEVALNNRIKELQYYYDLKIKEIDQTNNAVEAMEYRDDNIYRIVLGTEPIDKNIRNAGIGGADRYADIREKRLVDEEMIISLSEKVDKLKRKVYLELKSQDEVLNLAEL